MMDRIRISDADIKDPVRLRQKIEALYEQTFSLLQKVQTLEQNLRSGVGTVAGLTEADRALIRQLAIGSTENPIPAQKPVVPSGSALPATAVSTNGELFTLTTTGVVYRFDGPTLTWVALGASSPSNMVTTDTAQSITAAKTFTPASGTSAIIVTAGQISSTSQFGCSAFPSAPQSINNTTVTVIALDTESFDRGPCHDNAVNNSRVTIPTGGAGIWLFLGQIGFAASAVGVRKAVIRGSGAVDIAQAIEPGPNGADVTVLGVSTIASVNAADYVELTGYQSSGGALNTSIAETFLVGYRLC